MLMSYPMYADAAFAGAIFRVMSQHAWFPPRMFYNAFGAHYLTQWNSRHRV